MTRSELDHLAEVAKLLADRELAALAALRADRDRLAREADALRGRGPQADPDAPDALDPAARAGAGQLWQRWREAALRRLEAERASLAAREAAARETARLSFGRQVALEELARETADPKRRR